MWVHFRHDQKWSCPFIKKGRGLFYPPSRSSSFPLSSVSFPKICSWKWTPISPTRPFKSIDNLLPTCRIPPFWGFSHRLRYEFFGDLFSGRLFLQKMQGMVLWLLERSLQPSKSERMDFCPDGYLREGIWRVPNWMFHPEICMLTIGTVMKISLVSRRQYAK